MNTLIGLVLGILTLIVLLFVGAAIWGLWIGLRISIALGKATRLSQKEQYNLAIVFYKKALHLHNLLSLKNAQYTTILNNLGVCYQEIVNYTEALPLYQQALEIRQTVLGNNHPHTATSLENLALLYRLMGRYEEALPLYQQALEIHQTVLDNNHPDTAQSLNNLAALYHSMGRYEEALPLQKQALEIRQTVLGNNHPDTATSLNNLAVLYNSMGRYEEALPVHQQALEISQTVLDNNHPNRASSLNNLAVLYSLMGRYEEALPLYQQTLEISQTVLGNNHPDTTQSLNNLALLYRLMGRYEEALLLHQQALEIRQTVLGNHHPDTATSLNNLALLYKSMGRYEETLPLYQQALEICQTVLGNNHPHTAGSLSNLAVLYNSMGRYEEALPLHQQALEIRQTVLDNNHPDTALSLNNLAVLYQSMGRYEEALSLYQQALDIRQTVLGNNHPHTATSLNNLAALYGSMGRYEEALPLSQKALEIRQTILGNNHPDTALSLNKLAILLIAINRYDEAFNKMLEASKIELKLISQIFQLSSERQRLKYFEQNYPNFEGFLSLVSQYLPNNPEAIQATFEVVQQRKFIVLESNILQKEALLSGRYPHLTPLFQEYQEKAQQVINLSLQLLTDENQKKYRDELIKEQEQIEQELSRQLPELNLEERLLKVTSEQIASALPQNSTLVEFIRFNVFDFKAIPANGDQPVKPPRYLAFILPAAKPEQLKMIDLGEAATIDEQAKRFREVVSSQLDRIATNKISTETEVKQKIDEISQNKQQLKKLLFDPIEPHLSNHIIIAPDGELTCLPFELLPVTDNTYLMDHYTINYLNVGRDLIRLQFPTDVPLTAPIIITNPDYNLRLEAENIPPLIKGGLGGDQNLIKGGLGGDQNLIKGGLGGNQNRNTPEKLEEIYFTPLPGTALEGEKIGQYLQITPITEKRAVETVIKSLNSPRILHIATHGYFLSVEDISQGHQQNPFLFTNNAFMQMGVQNLQNPLLRAGLAFAGANSTQNNEPLPPEAEDGILTAQDIATKIDLRGTELVILSACQTGLGEVKTGLSVQGLRTAFLQAGAKNLIVSLWTVNDISTALLMEKIYYYFLEENLTPSEALPKAKNDIRNLTIGKIRNPWLTPETINYVGRYSPKIQQHLQELCSQSDNIKPYQHPKYWGAFICIGESEAKGTTYTESPDSKLSSIY
ncbi:Tetratricopeptide TPR_2 repeat protein [Gloeothece citriformis PCC 7424]|uniref:Tetratricopeptide TPR_2 repeat protein n=1 Tax=Gloeothece citriformis (strain PCC 7424) TaxID=65393 RepID=B7KCD1_GLOC7|nr:CHAT domain-containing tetratricopeptide repeat protein [Gloeothece citriformis]ACK70236.1 Tetratricopeptide TPR_2 repeat protein [Gloeothece citriformis PCC 7424]